MVSLKVKSRKYFNKTNKKRSLAKKGQTRKYKCSLMRGGSVSAIKIAPNKVRPGQSVGGPGVVRELSISSGKQNPYAYNLSKVEVFHPNVKKEVYKHLNFRTNILLNKFQQSSPDEHAREAIRFILKSRGQEPATMQDSAQPLQQKLNDNFNHSKHVQKTIEAFSSMTSNNLFNYYESLTKGNTGEQHNSARLATLEGLKILLNKRSHQNSMI